MIDILTVYAKTQKGIRKRNALLVTLLSPMQSRILGQIDGKANVKDLIAKFDNASVDDIERALNTLLQNGYIRIVDVTKAEWLPTENFTPMIIEEFSDFDEIMAKEQAETQKQAESEARQKADVARQQAEAKVKAKLEAEAKVEAERKAKEETKRLEAERKAKEAEEKARAKAEAEAKVEAERKAKEEAKRLEAERKAKEAEEKARIEAEEARQQAEAERKAKEEAERLEAERKAKEAEEQARIEAERLAAEQKAREEAEAKAKAEAEEKARIEAEERAITEAERLASEQKAREEAEAEEKARIEAERLAKEETERKAKIEAEERAKTEAEATAKLEVERIAQELAEARQRVRADKKTKKEAEREAKEEAERLAAAEQKSKEEAEEKARIEAEEAKFAAEQAAKEEKEIKKKRDAEKKAEQAAKLQASILAQQIEEDARLKKLDEERATKKALQEEVIVLDGPAWEDSDENTGPSSRIEPAPGTEAEATSTADRMAQEMEEDDGFVPTGMEEEKDEAASPRVESDAEKLEALKRAAAAEAAKKPKLTLLQRERALKRKINQLLMQPGKMAIKAAKTSVLIGALVLFLALGLLPYVPLNTLIAPVEQLAQEQLSTTVKVHQVSAALLPRPHFILKNVEIGSNAQTIEQVHLWPELGSLLDEVKVIKSIKIHDVKVTQDNFGQALAWLNAAGNSPKLKTGTIYFDKVILSAHDFDIGEFDGEIVQTPEHKVQKIQLDSTDSMLHLQITPHADNADVMLDAKDWTLPIQNKIKFKQLNGSGTFAHGKLELSHIQGDLYDGRLIGNTTVDWSSQWAVRANFSLADADAAHVLKALGSPIEVEGKLKNWKGNLDSQAEQADKLASNMNMSSDFEITRGRIEGLDIAQAAMAKSGQPLAGESTRFDSLQGSLQISNQQYRLDNLILNSKHLHARGEVTIAADGEISGNINANLTTPGRRNSASANLAGRGRDIRLR